MDETQQVMDAATQLAQISRDLNTTQMLFFVTVSIIVIGAMIFLLFFRFTLQNSKQDNYQQTELLKALAIATRNSADSVRVFREERKIYWTRNTREHKQFTRGMKQMYQVLNKIVILLEEHNKLEANRGKNNETINPDFISSSPSVSNPGNTRTKRSPRPFFNE